MWESDCLSFAQSHSISPRSAKLLKATAEHLQARCDGGQDARQNIVAACHYCNQKRHHRKTPPSPNDYRELVQRRLAKGGWHSKLVLAHCRG
ncbi:HNH endonuclease [Vogesella indigofera]|uniref:HNH endonuclease n=1 Tax=Vogesella indigofera TaxID=45465 RepID=UPI003570E9CE